MTPYTFTFIQTHPAFDIELSKNMKGFILVDPTGKKYFRFSGVQPGATPTLPLGWSWYTDPNSLLNSIESDQGKITFKYGKDEGYYAIVDDQNNLYINLPFGLLWA